MITPSPERTRRELPLYIGHGAAEVVRPQPDVRFPLGRTFITRGAPDALMEAGQSAA